jgi:cation:H+ antiporter
MFVWVQFALCLGLIGYAGVKLTRYGDAIADKTGLGRTWVGVLLLAAVTSLPEFATGITSVTVAGVPDIAVGDILGSCVFNLLILAFLDVINRRESVYREASQGHILSAGFGVVLLGIIGMGIVLSSGDSPTPGFGHIGYYSLLLIVLYIIAMRTVFRYEMKRVGDFTEQEPDNYPQISLRQTVVRYLAAASVVVGAGIWLPFVGATLADQMGWNESFVGTLFVAVVTSLPEMVVTVAAVRMGALDMAVGNVLGSNLFNTVIIAVDDLFYATGPLLSDVDPNHVVSAFTAIMMTGVAVVGFLYRPHRIHHIIGWASIMMAALFLFNGYTQYH